MSTGEDLGRTENVAQERTARLAREAGERAVDGIKELLERHSDLLGPALISLIIDREFEKASTEIITARAEGRANDNYSEATGLTAFITKEGYEGLREAAEREAQEAPYLTGYVESMQPVDEQGTVYSLILPQGAYSMGFGGCQIYGEVNIVDGRPEDRRNPVAMSYGSVVRIEGFSGELWQNVDFTPDGVIKERNDRR
jgi:hypothetical protein